MQSDVLNDQQQQLPNKIDCSTSLSTKLIYSDLKLHPKPLLPTISMSSMASPVSIVKKISLPDTHPDHMNKSLSASIRHSQTSTSSSSIRLVTPTTGKSSPPTALQFQFLDKPSATNGGFTTSKTYIFNPQQTNTTGTSSSLVTLIPPGTTSPKIQTLISSTNDFTTNNDHTNMKQPTFLSKNRVTLVQPIITNSSSSSSSSTTNTVTPKLVIQQNSSSNIWSQQPTTKILSAKMLSRPVHLISSNEHSNLSTSNDHPIFTTKHLDSGHQAFIHMSLLPSPSSTESINSVQLTNFYSTPPSVRISTTTTQRSMDYNNNHSVTTPIIREIQTDEKLNNSTIMRNIQHNKNSIKNRTRLPLQPSTQQISSILPPKKHKLPEDEQISSSEPPNKIAHYEQFDSSSNGKKVRKCRHKSLSKISLENTTPNPPPPPPSALTSSISIETTERIISKKRSSAELAAAAILLSSPIRKKRIQRKNSDEALSNNHNHNNDIKQELLPIDESSIDTINDELLKRLSQDFVYVDKQTGIRWIGTKSRSKPMNTLLSRFSWKPKINHYERYSDIIRMNPKRTVPIKSLDTIRKKLTQPWGSWRIDRLTTYLTDLTEDEQTSQNNLSDIAELLDELNINDHSIRNTIKDLLECNIQRHRYFYDQLAQISTILINLLDHGNTLREICSTSRIIATPILITNLTPTAGATMATTTRKIKDRW
ncbi:unnamed protein product [Rotaria magnacalcarata]|uniref:Uncharacterized protein n=1 Tax=Rotaria magnacalcarata TaxID=392030 RepID=A0A816ZHZ5_9BILA|nr:unnamed protein product [Rotaria magnacalcarata]CAF1626890.1 unnamed protein product [Rotaria magnacalcarata]CAF2214889.1 unnamed protein product [Rotaria magnacalcarata]CAF3838203.1 unnamed protein product [Rotaria magnacalcarata]CAF3845013.1 unnamed protein product [Rotaria magnacalcarata]